MAGAPPPNIAEMVPTPGNTSFPVSITSTQSKRYGTSGKKVGARGTPLVTGGPAKS